MKFKKKAKRKYQDLEFWTHRQKINFKRPQLSNFDEEKILRKYIAELGIAQQSKTVVDIGAGNGVRDSNTYRLVMEGWRCLGVEYDSRKTAQLAAAYKFYPNAFAARCQVAPANVVNLLLGHDIEREFGVFSLDIDSYDYWVLDAVLSEFRPRIVVTEINEKIPPPIKFVVNYMPDFELTHHFFGYSLAALSDLLEKHNYALLELEYNNAFLAPAELPGVKSVSIEEAYRRGYAERADRKEKFRPNFDVEELQTLSPEKGVEFINRFFARHQGKYSISID